MIVPQEIRLIGQSVRSLQTMLRELSFSYQFRPRLTPDGIFGERTLEAVMLFQREFHPPVTGQVDQSTWEAIATLYRKVRLDGPFPCPGKADCDFAVPPGQNSIHLFLIQSMFQALARQLDGVTTVPATGRNDAATRDNILWVQRIEGMPETGILDQAVWNTVSRLYVLFISRSRS